MFRLAEPAASPADGNKGKKAKNTSPSSTEQTPSSQRPKRTTAGVPSRTLSQEAREKDALQKFSERSTEEPKAKKGKTTKPTRASSQSFKVTQMEDIGM